MKPVQHHHIAAHRIVAAALAVIILGFSWDVWWHVVVIRDNAWEPPHLLIFASVAVAVVATVREWLRTRSTEWRRLLLPIFGLPIAAFVDQIWHEAFGAEDLSSPLIAFSPPHIVIGIALLLTGILLLPLIHRDHNARAQEVFGSVIFGVLMTTGLFLTVPFHPIFYGFGVFGFAGTGIVALVFALLVLSAADWRPTFAGGTLSVIIYLLFYSVAFNIVRENPAVKLNLHSLPPMWLVAFAYLVPALFVDFFQRAALWVRGGFAGFLYSAIMFGTVWKFLPIEELQYSLAQGVTGVVACTVGGAVAGVVLMAVRSHVRRRMA